MDKEKINLDISYTTLLKLLLFGGLVWLAIKLVSLFFIIILGYIIAVTLSPLVHKIRGNKRLPLGVSVVFLYLIMLILFAGCFFFIAQPLINQTIDFVNSLPDYVDNFINNSSIFSSFSDQITSFISSNQIMTGLQGALDFLKSILGGLAGVAIALVLSIYLILDKDQIINSVIKFLPSDSQKSAKTIIGRVDEKLGAWLRGQLLLCLMIGVLSYIGLTILGIPYALPLAVFAGFLEIIPTLGPTVTLVTMVFIAIATGKSWLVVVLVAIWFVAQQLFENYMIVPRVMKKAVGLSPVVTIVAIIGGSMAFGLIGAVMAVPVTATISIILNEYLELRKK